MVGVIYHGNLLLPGAAQFVDWLKREGKRFLFLTNSSERSPGRTVPKTGAARHRCRPEPSIPAPWRRPAFLASQKPNGSSYVIGEPGLIHALYRVGYTMNNVNPDYVVVGEASSYNLDTLIKAVRLVMGGAKLIGTNPDLTGPGEGGLVPACGALVAPIELATGRKAYFVGKPNPLMMRHALRTLGTTREETIIVGDRMDTDIIAGIESQIETVLVLTGVTTEADLPRFAYAPSHVLESVLEYL